MLIKKPHVIHLLLFIICTKVLELCSCFSLLFTPDFPYLKLASFSLISSSSSLLNLAPFVSHAQLFFLNHTRPNFLYQYDCATQIHISNLTFLLSSTLTFRTPDS